MSMLLQTNLQAPLQYRAVRGRSRGLSLIELMVTIFIIAILLAVAVPSFSSLIASQRTKNAASMLYAALARARSEAITRNTNVSLAATDGAWVKGWQIVDLRQPLAAVEVHNALNGLTSTGASTIVYQSTGRIQGNATPVVLIQAPNHDAATQCISIEPSGRPYMKTAATC